MGKSFDDGAIEEDEDWGWIFVGFGEIDVCQYLV
jgi:hypothetical protein